MQVLRLLGGLLLSLLYLPFSFAVTLTAYVLAPILPLFANDGWLPIWLSWFQTPDASINGDSGWKNSDQHPWVNNQSVYVRQVL